MTGPGISIVIPAYNEERFLPATLQAAKLARERLENTLKVASEIVVVNNDSTDRTKDVALAHGARVIDHSVRVIASVRNAGIQNAAFDIVVAIDADSFLPPDGLVEIWRTMRDPSLVGGALGVKLITDKLAMKVAAFLVQQGVRWVSGIEGAMFFFRRDDALAIGGFSERHLIAEDTVFAADLRRHGKLTGRKFILLKSVQVGTLDRKEIRPREMLPMLVKIAKALRGSTLKTDDLKFWYDPKR